MKVPFRQQATEYDCVPTSLLNALCYLFRRKELPPYVVHRIYKDCLDYEAARGTTGRAIQDIGHWLSCYREKRFATFAMTATYVYGGQVHLKRNSKIISCLAKGGAVLICVQISQNDHHCILGLSYERDWLYCYDPLSCFRRRYIDREAVQFIELAGQHAPNMRIRLDWLERNHDGVAHPRDWKYILGNVDDRECLLLNRIYQ